MKIVAVVMTGNCQGQTTDDQAELMVEYSCGDLVFSSSLAVSADLNRTEAELRDDVRAAVSADVNTKRGLSTTAADVRLFG